MERLGNVFSLNREAVHLLQLAEYIQASLLFRQALRLIQASLAINDKARSASNEETRVDILHLTTVPAVIREGPSEGLIEDDDSLHPQLTPVFSGFFVLQETLPGATTAPSAKPDEFNLSERDAIKTIAVILFNLGQCYLKKDPSEHSLLTALEFFESANHVIRRCSTNWTLTADDPFVVFLMALAVNTAHVYQELCVWHGVEKNRNVLKELISWAGPAVRAVFPNEAAFFDMQMILYALLPSYSILSPAA